MKGVRTMNHNFWILSFTMLFQIRKYRRRNLIRHSILTADSRLMGFNCVVLLMVSYKTAQES